MEEWRGILCPNKKLSLTTGCDSCDCFSKSTTLTVLCCHHAVSLYVEVFSLIFGFGKYLLTHAILKRPGACINIPLRLLCLHKHSVEQV